MNVVSRLNRKIDSEFIKNIFDHVRNLLICAFLLAVGTSNIKEEDGIFFSISQGSITKSCIVAIALILIAINTYNGIRIINNEKFNRLISISLVFLYLFLTVNILEMGWDLRMASFQKASSGN